jgi:hypothetical protein
MRRIAFLLGALVVLAVIFAAEFRAFARTQKEIQALQLRRSILDRALAEIHQQNAAEAEELAEARRQINALQASQAADLSTKETADKTRAWLGKLTEIRRRLADHPEESIPELKELDLRHLLGVAKEAKFDTEEHARQSLADLRSAAKERFLWKVESALEKYLGSRDGELPKTISELVPFLGDTADAVILDRYKMTRSGNLNDNPALDAAVILERAPVDEDYDVRAGVDVHRKSPDSLEWIADNDLDGEPIISWIDNYQERFERAQSAYASANNGKKAVGFAELASYFSPPIPPSTMQKLIARENPEGPP